MNDLIALILASLAVIRFVTHSTATVRRVPCLTQPPGSTAFDCM